MKTLLLLVISLLSLSSTFAEHKEIPNFLTVCKQSDPKIVECIINVIESLRPKLITGLPEFSIPSIEPFNVGDLVLAGKDKKFVLKINNVVVNGGANFKLNKLITKNQLKNFDMEILLPRLHIEGNYNINGQILALPVKGNGQFNTNITNSIGNVKIIGEIVEINDEKHYSIKDLNLKIKVGKGHIMLTNLFGGDKVLGDAINLAINEHFDGVIKDLVPSMEKILSEKFKIIGNNFLDNFTFMQLFPE